MNRVMNKTLNDSRAGQSLLEFALVVPVILAVIFGLFDLGYAVYAQNTISTAAREGARMGIILGNDDNAIRVRVYATSPGLTLTDSQIHISPSPSRTFSQPITVTINYTYTAVTPVIGQILGSGGKLSLSSTSVMIVEGVTPP